MNKDNEEKNDNKYDTLREGNLSYFFLSPNTFFYLYVINRTFVKKINF